MPTVTVSLNHNEWIECLSESKTVCANHSVWQWLLQLAVDRFLCDALRLRLTYPTVKVAV